MHSFSENSKGEEALLHPQNTYSQVIQKKDEGVDKKMFLIYRECCLNRKRKKQCFKRRKAAL